MKKYILIQNDGEIEQNCFNLIGASTKRNSNDKIGFFGSGLKYALAYLIRNNLDFKVFSGENEFKFTTKKEMLKDQGFDVICLNGVPTSYTTSMGPTWTQDWFVLREIYCNALDEDRCQLIKEIEMVNPVPGKTRIYIELTPSFTDIIREWDQYFSEDREPLFTANNVYTSYLGNSDIPSKTNQDVKIFTKKGGILYRKGIKCYENKNLLYDYDFEAVNINEDRTAKDVGALSYCVLDLVGRLINEDYVKNILSTVEDPCDEYYYLSVQSPPKVSEAWINFSKNNLLVVKEISGKFIDIIYQSKKNVYYLPSLFAKQIKKKYHDISILGLGSMIGDTSYSEIEPTKKIKYLLNEVLYSLKQMNYEIHHIIKVVVFESDAILGMADAKNKEIYLSEKLFDKGRRDIALTLIEETEHIDSGYSDETRAFQTHLISVFLKNMENNNGIFL